MQESLQNAEQFNGVLSVSPSFLLECFDSRDFRTGVSHDLMSAYMKTPDSLPVVQLDFQEFPQMFNSLCVRRTPTVILFRHRLPYGRIVDECTLDELEAFIERIQQIPCPEPTEEYPHQLPSGKDYFYISRCVCRIPYTKRRCLSCRYFSWCSEDGKLLRQAEHDGQNEKN